MKEFKDLSVKQKYDILQTAFKAQLEYYKEALGRCEAEIDRQKETLITTSIYAYSLGRKQEIEQFINSLERWAEE